MKHKTIPILMALLTSLFFASASHAQSEELTLSLSRDFGYSSGTGDIQGTFSMKATGPDTLVSVEFYIDSTLIAKDVEPPFKVQFVTDNYPLGLHTLYAVGYTSAGGELRTREVHANFVSADEGWQAAAKIIVPVLGLIVVAALLSAIVPALGGGKKRKQNLPPGERNYGVVGGTICPRCKHPFALPMFSPNMLVGKLVRCDSCGKWFIGRRATSEALRAAEETEWAQAHSGAQVPEISEDEKLKKEIDDSKFQGL
jgi:hypothetical protein